MQAFFLDAKDAGQRFCIHHAAQGPVKRGQMLYLHPFAEEMNKSRRMAALQARALAKAGFEVLQIDMHGCGDSSGDFGDATWEAWVADALLGRRWLADRLDGGPLWLWGLRAGCLVAAEVLRQTAPANLLFIQPPLSGKPVLQQFLRVKAAASIVDGSGGGMMAEMRATLARGESVEIAGYALNAALARQLEAVALTPPDRAGAGHRVVWLELRSQADADWTPSTLQGQQRWRDAGYAVESELVVGPAFWQTAEIEEAPALIEATCRLLKGTAQVSAASTPPSIAA